MPSTTRRCAWWPVTTTVFSQWPNAGPAPLSRTWPYALLLHSFQVFKQRSEPYVDLKVLESNLRARQLYESAGMRFVLRDVVSKG